MAVFSHARVAYVPKFYGIEYVAAPAMLASLPMLKDATNFNNFSEAVNIVKNSIGNFKFGGKYIASAKSEKMILSYDGSSLPYREAYLKLYIASFFFSTLETKSQNVRLIDKLVVPNVYIEKGSRKISDFSSAFTDEPSAQALISSLLAAHQKYAAIYADIGAPVTTQHLQMADMYVDHALKFSKLTVKSDCRFDASFLAFVVLVTGVSNLLHFSLPQMVKSRGLKIALCSIQNHLRNRILLKNLLRSIR